MKKSVFSRLLRSLYRWFGWQMVAVTVCIALSAAAPMVGLTFQRRLIDNCIVPGLKDGLAPVWKNMIALLTAQGCIFAMGVVATAVYTQLMAIIEQGALKRLRDEMFGAMEAQPVSFFDSHERGDIMSTYTNDTDALRQMVGQALPVLFQALVTVAVTLVIMLSYSVWLTLIAGTVLLLMSWLTKHFGSESGRYMGQQQASLARTEGFVEEIMQGEKVVKVFNHEPQSKARFDELNNQLFEDCCNANRSGNELMPILNNVGNLMYVVVALTGALMALLHAPNLGLSGGAVTVGMIMSFLGLCRGLTQTVGQISMQVPVFTMGIAGAERVFTLTDLTPEQDDGFVTLVHAVRGEDGTFTESDSRTGLWAWKYIHRGDGSVSYTQLGGKVELDHVDFGYTPEKQILFDVSLTAQPGQKIAFVGTTGAGKTTITNLINRFYDIADGKIRYDGININKIKKPDLRHSLGMVLQEVNLFSGTVMDNIRYGKLDASDEDCINAAKLANAHDFISRLPDGYQTCITASGGRLSQGQRQLISIARAAVADPPVMILDEATSSIDTRTEALVQKGMDNLMKVRTVFVIAHRLSTVRNSDSIMVLDHGRIIERGSHDELMALKGTYYKLYTGSFDIG